MLRAVRAELSAFSQCPQWIGGVTTAFPLSSQEGVGTSLSLVLFLWSELSSLAVGSDLLLFLIAGFAILLPKCLWVSF